MEKCLKILWGMALRNLTYKTLGFILVGILAGKIQINGQIPQQKMCQNPAFEEEVRSYLDFTIPIMSVLELKNSQEETILLDAREEEEYNLSHIPGAKYIGYNNFKKADLQGISKDSKIVVYCSIGYRSEKIAEKLKEMGYHQVHNLFGSIFEWANRGYPLENSNGKSTLTIHTFNKNWSKWVDNTSIQKKW